ncbi:MAG: DUF1501 domain-containing protein [Planctomycetota bacterium]|nr:MAG: DUF1501 domain-containing protein [Planctomycetota bacterium]REK22134.1 MAG: DUF1501 domain-containing protein [Planctomycetota bacterium]REK34946.1 MAG: DUF1501 domain-containing protein [Planctomycetota bacterium]
MGHAAARSNGGWTSRRTVLKAGSAGLLGSSLIDQGRANPAAGNAKSVLFVFLTGGISQHDSFDMKPDAPADVRGEFHPILTATAGTSICEHLPLLAQRTNDYALVRSVASNSNAHEVACHMLLTGRLDLPPGFTTGSAPSPNEWPSIPSQVTYALHGRGNPSLPPAVVLPQPSVNEAARFRPGQYAGRLGKKWEAWHVDIAAKCALGNGACPHCFRFDEDHFEHGSPTVFSTPMLTLPEGGPHRLGRRIDLLGEIELQQRGVRQVANLREVDAYREQAISVLADPKVRRAFDVENADAETVDRYGRNKFGLSLLMGQRLLEAGVRFVQVNLGKNSSWDTHRRNFVNLKRNLLPYLDQSLSALLDDLNASGRLKETLVLVTGEFGRTPRINKDAGRDHWGPVMTSLFAGGGVRGGNVIGASDGIGAYAVEDPLTVENLAATMYDALGIPEHQSWSDVDGRPYEMRRAEPIHQLF